MQNKFFHEKYGMPPEMPEIKIDPGVRSQASAEERAFGKQPIDLDIYSHSNFVEEHQTDRDVTMRTYEYQGNVYQLNPDQIAYLEDLKKTSTVQ
jgi:hypothetical protein